MSSDRASLPGLGQASTPRCDGCALATEAHALAVRALDLIGAEPSELTNDRRGRGMTALVLGVKAHVERLEAILERFMAQVELERTATKLAGDRAAEAAEKIAASRRGWAWELGRPVIVSVLLLLLGALGAFASGHVTFH